MRHFTVTELNAHFADADAGDIVRFAIEDIFVERIALVSSFGTEAAVLLHMVALVDRALPVLFLNTLKHFDETIAYRDRLIDRLRLSDVRSIQPSASEIDDRDPTGLLWARDTDACCALRKIEPLKGAMMRFDALISGRKRHHGDGRTNTQVFEQDGARIRVNPLAGWSRNKVRDYLDGFGLPRHPLEADGYPSVGCAVCTSRVAPGESFRAGRWRGSSKTECGIHLNRSQS